MGQLLSREEVCSKFFHMLRSLGLHCFVLGTAECILKPNVTFVSLI